MKVSELEGAQLDWVVAKCDGVKLAHIEQKHGNTYLWLPRDCGEEQFELWSPATNWAQGGSIIEREKIDIAHLQDGCVAYMFFSIDDYEIVQRSEYRGETPLIAAMRCYVVSKLGAEVEIPDELMEV